MIVNMKELLENAKKGNYAIPHLNINNLEWTRYILEACQEKSSPVILGVSEGASKYMGGYKTVSNMVFNLIEYLQITIPVVLHLDHGNTVESCKEAIDAGFSSVMIDASIYDLEMNIKITNEVVDYAHKRGVTVEAEIGRIGGSEDGNESSIIYTSLEEAIEFSNRTSIDALAPALGSVHGIYKGEPKIDFNIMSQISEATNLPLVLHGGTGINDEKIKLSIASGICKININTELQIAWATAMKIFILNNKDYDPRTIIRSGEQAIKEAVAAKIDLLGSSIK